MKASIETTTPNLLFTIFPLSLKYEKRDHIANTPCQNQG